MPAPPLLAGLRVLEMTQVLSGPFGGQILADLGALAGEVEDDGTNEREVLTKDGRWLCLSVTLRAGERVITKGSLFIDRAARAT